MALPLWRGGFLYWAASVMLRFAIYLFFKNIVVVGRKRLPDDVPIIFAVNHPNMLLDSILVVAASQRVCGFWAKAPLFANPISGRFLRAVHAVPVKRSMDQKAAGASAPAAGSSSAAPAGGSSPKIDNQSLYSESFDALDRGICMMVFPEGTSVTEPYMLSLKDGASYLALEYAMLRNKSVAVVPTYLRKDKFRSDALVTFAPPILVGAEMVSAFREEDQSHKVAKQLTADIYERLKSVTVNAPDWHTLRLVHAARRLFVPSTKLSVHEYVELTRRFLAKYDELKDQDDVRAFVRELDVFIEELHDMNLADWHVRQRLKVGQLLWLALESIGFFLVLLPLGTLGELPFAPVYALAKFFGTKSSMQEERATHKVILSILVMIALFNTYIGVAWLFFGWRVGVALAGALSLVAVANVRLLDYQKSVLYTMRSYGRLLYVLLFKRRDLKALRKTRAELATKLRELVAVHGSDLPPLSSPTSDAVNMRFLRNKDARTAGLGRTMSYDTRS